MRFGLLFSFLLWSLCASQASAGAWMREKGKSFTSFSYTITYFRETANTTYLEYGLRDDLTIGADIRTATSKFGSQSGYGTLFLRRPLGPNEGENKWAYEIGIGAGWVDEIIYPYVKTGVSWGRGIKLREKYGWVAVDASMAWDFTAGRHVAKVDTTLGLNFTDVTTGMVQLYLSNLDNETYGSIAPSVVLKPGKSKFRYQIGAEGQFGDFDNTALKIGLWREF